MNLQELQHAVTHLNKQLMEAYGDLQEHDYAEYLKLELTVSTQRVVLGSSVLLDVVHDIIEPGTSVLKHLRAELSRYILLRGRAVRCFAGTEESQPAQQKEQP